MEKVYQKYICNYVNDLTLEERIEVIKRIRLKATSDIINQNSDGVRIELDKLDKLSIIDIYNFIKDKIDFYKNNK